MTDIGGDESGKTMSRVRRRVLDTQSELVPIGPPHRSARDLERSLHVSDGQTHGNFHAWQQRMIAQYP